MNRILVSIAAVALLLMVGCKNTNSNVGPGLLRLGVSTTAGYSILKYPEAVPAVKASADIICSAAHGTNLSPANIVAALDAYGGKTPESVFIVNAAVGAYALIYNGLSSTNAATASPYALAVCDGLNDALLMSPSRGRNVNWTPLPQWPQVSFP